MKIEIAVDAQNGIGEGPFWDAESDALLWVDISGKAVFRWREGEATPQRWQFEDFPSGVVLTRSGGALLAMRRGVFRFDQESAALAPFCQVEPDRPANRSNEAKCDAAGRFWVGTMQCNLAEDGSPREMTANTGALYRIGIDGSVTRELDGIGIANTLAWTEDRRTQYFADTIANAIWAFDSDPESGALSNRRVFCTEALPGYCDGSTIDDEGCLWNARFGGGCVVRLTPAGKVDRVIEVPVSNPTSCCFGGGDGRTLFVTSSNLEVDAAQRAANPREGAVLAIAAGIGGAPSYRFAG